VGVDLSVTVTAPLVGLVSWPVRVLWGPEAQINAVQLGAAFLAAALTYFLILRVVGGDGGSHRAVAAIGGAAFAFTPYRFVHLGEHLNLIHTGLLPACLLLALRAVERPSTARFAALGAGLGVGALIEPQLAVISAIGAACLVVRRWEGPPPRRPAIVAGVAVAVATAAPVAVPLLLGMLGGESSAAPAASALPAFSSRLPAWILPAPFHPWFGGLARAGVLWSPLEGIAAPGLVVLGLALVGRRPVPTGQRRGWVAMTWAAVILSLGPFVALGHDQAPIPLPYYLLRLLPFMDTMRVPGRFAILGVLGLCVLAAQAATAALDRPRSPARPWGPAAAAVVLTALLAVELLPGPIVTRAGGAPEPYSAIAADHGHGAVLEIPLQWSTGVDLVGYPRLNVSLFEAWATVHERPYVGGTVSRYPADRQAELESIPLYRQVRALQGDEGFTGRVDFDAHDLADLGIGYVVYHRDLPVPRARRYLEGLHLPVLADDGVVIAWRVPAA
jgi:hypothetical protein